MVKNAAKAGGPALEEKLVKEGYLAKEKQTGENASLSVFTTTARQQIIFDEMKKIVKGYFELWYR